MAKRPAKATSETESSSATGNGGTKTYVVKPGQTVQHGGGDGGITTYVEGETLELSAKDADAMPWAVELEGSRARSGQTSRLKRQITDLQARIRELQADNDALSRGSDDPGLQEAKASIIGRADNFAARGEPTIGGVPNATMEAADRAFVADELGDVGKGFGDAEREPAPTTTGVAGSPTSQPSTLKPGQTQNPGDNKPADTNK